MPTGKPFFFFFPTVPFWQYPIGTPFFCYFLQVIQTGSEGFHHARSQRLKKISYCTRRSSRFKPSRSRKELKKKQNPGYCTSNRTGIPCIIQQCASSCLLGNQSYGTYTFAAETKQKGFGDGDTQRCENRPEGGEGRPCLRGGKGCVCGGGGGYKTCRLLQYVPTVHVCSMKVAQARVICICWVVFLFLAKKMKKFYTKKIMVYDVYMFIYIELYLRG